MYICKYCGTPVPVNKKEVNERGEYACVKHVNPSHPEKFCAGRWTRSKLGLLPDPTPSVSELLDMYLYREPKEVKKEEVDPPKGCSPKEKRIQKLIEKSPSLRA